MDLFPLVSFFTGVISILSPCILPILPIFIGFSLKSKSKTEIVSFSLGIFSIFTLIIFLTAFFTAIVYQYIYYVRIVSAVLLVIIAILMLTDHSFNFSVKPINHEGIVGSFFLGVLTSVAWVPCYSAYLMSLISLLVTSANPLFVSFNIVLYCLGFGLTLLALSFAISRVDLESFTKRTSFIPKIFAVLIIISAVYMLI